MSSAPHVKKGFDHFCLGRTRGGGPGGRTVFAVLPGAKEGLRRRSFTAPGQFPEIIWHGME